MCRAAMVTLLAGWAVSSVAAQPPAAAPQPPEQLPPPRQMVAPGPAPLPALPFQYNPYPMVPPPPPPRLDSRNAWALFAVDQSGRYRYRVIQSPYAPTGAYYLYDGRPFPAASLRQLYVQPKTTD
jgi:hypothetical protein